ncbi:MAG TPA: monovalent cation/H(+) antiporter subunit G [Methanoregulaceae archaeon]|nr:monovalent cation/H(+) antiporter subunit G [Methanoregulaceae archaeon]
MIAEVIVYLFLGIGTAFNALGIAGLLRFPDMYTRMHATTKMTTFGTMFTALAVVIYAIVMYLAGDGVIFPGLAIHTLIAAFALAFTNAVGSHALARAAHKSGIKPSPAVVDRLEEAGL